MAKGHGQTTVPGKIITKGGTPVTFRKGDQAVRKIGLLVSHHLPAGNIVVYGYLVLFPVMDQGVSHIGRPFSQVNLHGNGEDHIQIRLATGSNPLILQQGMGQTGGNLMLHCQAGNTEFLAGGTEGIALMLL